MKYRAFKYRIVPNEDQKILIEKTFGCVRKVYNCILSDNQLHYDCVGKSRYFQPTFYKKQFDFLNEVDSLALANARLNVKKAFNSFFRGLKGSKFVGFPKFKSKKFSRQSYTTNNQNGTVKRVGKYLRLPKIGKIRCKFHRELVGKIKSATISREANGKYYVSVLCELNESVKKPLGKDIEVCGVDFSFQHFAVLSSGERINPPKWYYNAEQKLAKLSRSVSRKKRGSENRLKARRKKAKFERKVVNKRKDFCHKLSRRLADSYDVVVFEDINLSNMIRHKNWGKTVTNLGFGMFREFMEYKLEDFGKVFLKADKFFPSTQKCSNCGYLNTDLKGDLKTRNWICPECHVEHDRDVNAAKNLEQYFYNTCGTHGIEVCGDSVRRSNENAVVAEAEKVLRATA